MKGFLTFNKQISLKEKKDSAKTGNPEIFSIGIFAPIISLHKGKDGRKKRWPDSSQNFCPLPFQTPTRLAAGLGLGSVLSLVILGNSPLIWVPRIHSLNGFRLLCDFTLVPTK
jgi:hypothetical protein